MLWSGGLDGLKTRWSAGKMGKWVDGQLGICMACVTFVVVHGGSLHVLFMNAKTFWAGRESWIMLLDFSMLYT